MKEHKPKRTFIDGAISQSFIAESIAKHSTKKDIGAHSIFLGQVRNDVINGKTVTAIEYSCYLEMADNVIFNLREEIIAKYELTCLHIFHSLGKISAGEICLFVFTSSKHRRNAIDACNELVERIKKDVPVWGKELFEDDSYEWKTNNFSEPKHETKS